MVDASREGDRRTRAGVVGEDFGPGVGGRLDSVQNVGGSLAVLRADLGRI